MTAFFSHFSWRTFLFYGLVIGLLGWKTWELQSEQEQRRVFHRACIDTNRQLGSILSRGIDQNLAEINRKTKLAYGAVVPEPYRNALMVQQLCVNCTAFLQQKLFGLWTPKGLETTALDVPTPTHDIPNQLGLLADSLRLVLRDDTASLSKINRVFEADRLSSCLQVLRHSPRTAKALAISTLDLLIKNLEYDLVLQINQSLPAIDEWETRRYIPMLQTENTCIRAGSYLEGALFASLYSTHTENMAMFVNGKPIRLEDGLGKYTGTYPSTGAQPLHTEIRVTNPLTKQSNSFNGDFFQKVCE